MVRVKVPRNVIVEVDGHHEKGLLDVPSNKKKSTEVYSGQGERENYKEMR